MAGEFVGTCGGEIGRVVSVGRRFEVIGIR